MKLKTLNCDNCNKDFSFPERHLKLKQKHKNNFCSKECRIDFKKVTLDIRKCVICEKDFSVKHYLKNKCCSRECADKITRPKTKILKCKCCDVEIKKSSYCKKCKEEGRPRYKKFNFKLPNEISLDDVTKRNGANRYDLVRFWARRFIIENNIELKCERCNYNKHVEIAHIKPICNFKPTDLISDINDLKNLKVLCPNCHWEFDNGLIV